MCIYEFVVPAELEQGLGARGGDAEVGPGEEVELSDGTRLVGLKVLQVEAAHHVVIAPDVLRDKMDLERWKLHGLYRYVCMYVCMYICMYVCM